MPAETTLYAAVKRFLEAQGFAAKGEVVGCDIVAVRPGEPPLLVICELKLQFNLDLLLQAADRMSVADRCGLPCRAPGGGGTATAGWCACAACWGWGC